MVPDFRDSLYRLSDGVMRVQRHNSQIGYTYRSEATRTNSCSDGTDGSNANVNIRTCTPLERKNHVKSMCDILVRSNKRKVDFLVSDEHKLAFCNIPKISSSAWKSIMMVSTKIGRRLPKPSGAHSPAQLFKRGLRETSNLTSIEDHIKFMIVRHPLDRLLSAYYDKMYRNYTQKDSHFDWLTQIRRHILKVKGNYSRSTLPLRVGLKEFVRFILGNTGISKFVHDKHWNKYAFHCDPCSIRYVTASKAFSR